MAAGRSGVRLVAGRYRLVARLGAGAMGTVWRAFDEILHTEAALKEIEFAGGVPESERAERVERALREARHAAKLRGHPNVVTILDVVLEDGLPWIVMELVPSRSLFDVVRTHGPLPVPEVARIGVAVLDALLAARSHGIIHRDVKPSNVLIANDGRVVLTDFGIATGSDDPTLTVTGVLGTPLYMAPERLNNAPATFESDLFSLGGTLYFAVEGRPPFERENFGAMLAAIMLHPPTPPQLAGPLADVLHGLLEKDPARRLPAEHARAMLAALAAPPAHPGPPHPGLPHPGPAHHAPAWPGPGYPASAHRPPVPHADAGRAGPPVPPGPGRPTTPVVRAPALGWRARGRPAEPADPRRPAEPGWQEEPGAGLAPTRPLPEPDDLSVTGTPPGTRSGGGMGGLAPTAELPTDPETVAPGTVSPGTAGPGAVSSGAAGPGAVSPGAAGPGAVPAPPARVDVVEKDGALLVFWEPSPSAAAYRVVRVVADPAAPGGRRERSLGTTTSTELFDAGAPKGVPVWHEVTALASTGPGAPKAAPVRGPTRVLLPPIIALRADMAGDAVELSWRPIPGHDEVIIERTHHESSPLRGAMRRYRASGGSFVDEEAQPGAVYRYRVWVAAGGSSDDLRPSTYAEVIARVVARPRPVLDLEARSTLGGTVLRWTTAPGATVRVYATEAPAQAGLAGTGPFGPADHEVSVGSLEGRARLVGESRRGRLVDREATGTVVYTPVSIIEDRAVIGAAITHTVP